MFRAVLLFLLLVSVIGLSAQTKNERTLIRQARMDVSNFRLSKTDLEQFRKNKKNIYSDLFKPNKSIVSDTALLSDSIYTKAFRSYAYIKTKSRVNTVRNALIGGGVVISAFVLLIISLQNGFDSIVF